jgi:predicted HTH transcriptional regulator
MSDEITLNTQTEAQIEPISEPIETIIPSEPEIPAFEPEPTAQIPVNEPLDTPEVKTAEPEPEVLSESIPETITEPVKEESKSSNQETSESKTNEPETVEPEKETSETKSEPKQETKPEPEQPKVIPVIISTRLKARELLVKARNVIQSRKRKKLDKVMSLFLKQSKITNDEVEKFMHVSDATTTRYLSQIEKEGKIKQTGKTGKSVFYSKI